MGFIKEKLKTIKQMSRLSKNIRIQSIDNQPKKGFNNVVFCSGLLKKTSFFIKESIGFLILGFPKWVKIKEYFSKGLDKQLNENSAPV